MRILIGLMGLEGNEEDVEKLLDQAQDTSYEEWVRMIAGLVQGSDESEVRTLMKTTAAQIMNQIHRIQSKTANDDHNPTQLATADADPTFCAYRYALLNPPILAQTIPEAQSNVHFTVATEVDILAMDSKLELQKAEEEKDHASTGAGVLSRPTAASVTQTATNQKPTPAFPGMARETATKKVPVKAAPKKASMFLTRKPALPAQANLHKRKAGAAQALLGKKRGRLGQNVSKMKMIDVSEVKTLETNVKRKAETTNEMVAHAKTLEQKPSSAEPKSEPKVELKSGPREAPHKLATAALSAYQAQVSAAPATTAAVPPPEAPANSGAAASQAKQQDWRELLKEKSNRLSADDRFRIQQFFVDRFNPTPDQPSYKIKLHEERSEKDGVPVKETYYLELDYATFTSKQSKKTKRYK
jgi:hypothetical protein